MRNLVSVRTVKELRPIPGADNIEVAGIDGWEVVVKKGEFKVGDPCAYFEIDSFLPIRPEFEFLRASSLRTMNGVEGFRLRTIRLRKQVSQGLALPLSSLGMPLNTTLGKDLTEALGVVKYDVEDSGQAQSQHPQTPRTWWQRLWYRWFPPTRKGGFPTFVPKTDETRVQNLSHMLESFAGLSFFATEKLDGSSFTAFRNGKDFGVCSRNFRLDRDPTNKWWKVAIKYDLERVLKRGSDYAIQGELIGPGIQGNRYKMTDFDLFVFNVYDIRKKEYLSPPALVTFCDRHKLNHVPGVDIGRIRTVRGILEAAEGKSLLCSTAEREGVVVVLVDEMGKRLRSFKAISNKFLLREVG